MRVALAVAAAALIAGCSLQPQQPPSAAEQVFQAKASYQALLVQAVNYRNRPACRPLITVPPRVNLPARAAAVAPRPAATNEASRTALAAPIARPPVAKPPATPVALPAADPTTCSDSRIVGLLRSADNAAEAVLDNAETTVRNERATPEQQAEAVSAAQSSVASFEHVLTQYGAH